MTTEIRIVLQNYINLAGEELENAVSLIDALDDGVCAGGSSPFVFVS